MRSTRSIGAVALALTGFACRPAGPDGGSAVDHAEITDSIRAIAAVFADGVSSLEVDRFAPYFQHPQLTWAADGQLMLIGPDSLLAFYRAAYRGFRTMEFAWDTIQVSALDRNTALMTAAGHFAVTDTAGTSTRQGVAVSYLFSRGRGRWELLHGHASHRVLP